MEAIWGGLAKWCGIVGHGMRLEAIFLNDSSGIEAKAEAWGKWQPAGNPGPLLQLQPWHCRHRLLICRVAKKHGGESYSSFVVINTGRLTNALFLITGLWEYCNGLNFGHGL